MNVNMLTYTYNLGKNSYNCLKMGISRPITLFSSVNKNCRWLDSNWNCVTKRTTTAQYLPSLNYLVCENDVFKVISIVFERKKVFLTSFVFVCQCHICKNLIWTTNQTANWQINLHCTAYASHGYINWGGVNGKIAIRLHLVHFSLTIGRTNITIKTTPNLVGQQWSWILTPASSKQVFC